MLSNKLSPESFHYLFFYVSWGAYFKSNYKVLPERKSGNLFIHCYILLPPWFLVKYFLHCLPHRQTTRTSLGYLSYHRYPQVYPNISFFLFFCDIFRKIRTHVMKFYLWQVFVLFGWSERSLILRTLPRAFWDLLSSKKFFFEILP